MEQTLDDWKRENEGPGQKKTVENKHSIPVRLAKETEGWGRAWISVVLPGVASWSSASQKNRRGLKRESGPGLLLWLSYSALAKVSLYNLLYEWPGMTSQPIRSSFPASRENPANKSYHKVELLSQ